jgi:hypothetical protein
MITIASAIVGVVVAQQEQQIKDGDWADYRITFEVTKISTNEYTKGTITFRITYTVSDEYVDYSLTTYNIESYDSNVQDIDPQSVAMGVIQALIDYIPLYVEPSQLPEDGIISSEDEILNVRAEYDIGTGILKLATFEFPSGDMTGTMRLELTGTSVAGVAPAAVGGLGGFSGGLIIMMIALAIVVVIILVIGIILLKRRKQRQVPYYGAPAPTTIPPPPPPPPG